MESTPRRRPAGFTLIELLVALGVVALLVALLLPVLGEARKAARGVGCGSNLAQMMRAWEVTVAQTKGRVDVNIAFPHTGGRSWMEHLMDAVELPALRSNRGVRSGHLICPEIEGRFMGPTYVNRACSYSINARRRPGQPVDDSRRFDWSTLQSPATYPWFADPTIELLSSRYVAQRDYFGVAAAPDWGLGFYHAQGSGRVAYADGHVEAPGRELLRGPVDAVGTPRGLLDVP